MDAPTSVTDAEEQALAEIAAELQVSDGKTWASLIRDLDSGAAPARPS
jgi:hypothetical protein